MDPKVKRTIVLDNRNSTGGDFKQKIKEGSFVL